MRKMLISGIVILVIPICAGGETVTVSAQELDNLGVRAVAPERATQVATTEGAARVVIPPMREAVIASSQPGLVTGLYVSPGDSVTRGQLLAELKSPEFLTLQREFLDAVSAHRLARAALERDTQLHAEGIISARRLEETRTNSAVAVAGLQEHRQLLLIAGLGEAEVRSLESGARLLESLPVRAPFDGAIIERLATAGQRIDSMSPIYRLADLSELWLEIAIPQEQLAGIRPGMSVRGDAGVFDAEVTSVGRSIDPATQSIIVRARVVRGGEALSPGQLVSVRVLAESGDAVVWTVPSSAVTRSGEDHYLFVLREAGCAVRTADLLAVSEGRAFVTADLQPSDRVAVSGVSALKALWSARQEAHTE